jgi:hypothetical protein
MTAPTTKKPKETSLTPPCRIKFQRSKNWAKTIVQCYNSDPDLIEKFHVLAPTDKTEATAHTIHTFMQMADTSSFEVFDCYVNKVFSGYFGIQVIAVPAVGKVQFLSGFFIMPEFRTDEYKKQFIKSIKKRFPNNKIMTVIFNKNTRAIRFFEKLGGKVQETGSGIVEKAGEMEYSIIVI